MKLFRKKKTIRDSQTATIETIQLWEVVWYSRHGDYSSDTRRQVEVFTSEESAKEFYKAINDAYDLLKYSYYNVPTVGKHN